MTWRCLKGCNLPLIGLTGNVQNNVIAIFARTNHQLPCRIRLHCIDVEDVETCVCRSTLVAISFRKNLPKKSATYPWWTEKNAISFDRFYQIEKGADLKVYPVGNSIYCRVVFSTLRCLQFIPSTSPVPELTSILVSSISQAYTKSACCAKAIGLAWQYQQCCDSPIAFPPAPQNPSMMTFAPQRSTSLAI